MSVEGTKRRSKTDGGTDEGPPVELDENGQPIPPEPETEEQAALRMLTEEIDGKTNESLESTRRMLNLCEESKDAGIRTLVMLDEQGEQLDRVNEGLDKINDDMRAAEKSLEDMEKCCGLCILPWKKTKNFESDPNYKDTWKAGEDGAAGGGPRPVVGEQMMIGGNMCTRITNDAREDEMENNLVEVNNMVGNLRNMAVDMGNEINSQNQTLDQINRKAGMNEERIKVANTRANKLMK